MAAARVFERSPLSPGPPLGRTKRWGLVERGIRSTASTVTSAAAVMIAVFAIFASLRVLDIKQLGVGLAIAVFLDATLIRGVLLPATMKLLGDWNWYLPRWLERMPRIGAEPTDPKPPEDVPLTPPLPVA